MVNGELYCLPCKETLCGQCRLPFSVANGSNGLHRLDDKRICEKCWVASAAGGPAGAPQQSAKRSSPEPEQWIEKDHPVLVPRAILPCTIDDTLPEQAVGIRGYMVTPPNDNGRVLVSMSNEGAHEEKEYSLLNLERLLSERYAAFLRSRKELPMLLPGALVLAPLPGNEAVYVPATVAGRFAPSAKVEAWTMPVKVTYKSPSGVGDEVTTVPFLFTEEPTPQQARSFFQFSSGSVAISPTSTKTRCPGKRGSQTICSYSSYQTTSQEIYSYQTTSQEIHAYPTPFEATSQATRATSEATCSKPTDTQNPCNCSKTDTGTFFFKTTTNSCYEATTKASQGQGKKAERIELLNHLISDLPSFSPLRGWTPPERPTGKP